VSADLLQARETTEGTAPLPVLGVVFGDIGTSPLYALRESFGGTAVLVRDSSDVLGAVEGLRVVAPALDDFVLPLTIAIRIGLLVAQRNGSGRIGQLFGPVMLLWFPVLGLLGVRGILMEPAVPAAFNPHYAATVLDYPGQAVLLKVIDKSTAV
jgi:K+ transporter